MIGIKLFFIDPLIGPLIISKRDLRYTLQMNMINAWVQQYNNYENKFNAGSPFFKKNLQTFISISNFYHLISKKYISQQFFYNTTKSLQKEIFQVRVIFLVICSLSLNILNFTKNGANEFSIL